MIKRENILGVGSDTCLINLGWERPCTPNTKDGKKTMIDCVEFEIAHKGIEKLERNIKSETEYVMCFVHFFADTETVEGIYLSIWDEDAETDDPISAEILSEEERVLLTEYAVKELHEQRICYMEKPDELLAYYDMLYPFNMPEDNIRKIIEELLNENSSSCLYKLAQDAVSSFLISYLPIGKRVTVVVQDLFDKGIEPEFVTLKTEDDENGQVRYFDLYDNNGVVCMDGETCIVLEVEKDRVKLLNEDGEQKKEFYLSIKEAGICLFPSPLEAGL